MISIIVAYRDRPSMLRTFLESLDRIAGLELVIVDLGSTGTREIIDAHRDRLNVIHRWIDYAGEFWKTKALNHGTTHTSGEFVSVVDVDSYLPARFFEGVEKRLAALGDRKLGFSINYRTAFETTLIRSYGVEWAREIYLPNLKGENWLYESHAGFLTGNSHFIIRRDLFLDLGGFDERFIGYGWEDHDFNMRCVANGIETVMHTQPVQHLWHKHEADWNTDKSRCRNEQLFRENKAKSWPKLSRLASWGKF